MFLSHFNLLATLICGHNSFNRCSTMPPSLNRDKALDIINNKGALDKVRDRFPNAIVFKDTDTLTHVEAGQRLVLCAFDEHGNRRTDPDANFPSTEIVVAAKLVNMYVGPRTTCKEIAKDNKQTVYAAPLEGNAASERFFEQLFQQYDKETYATHVGNHPMHAVSTIVKGGDTEKGVMGIARKNKVHVPVREDEDGNPKEFIARNKVFSTRHKFVETKTDFDSEAVKAFCADEAAKTGGTGACGVDLLPVFFANGDRCDDYDSLRSSEACIIVISLRGDWVSRELQNISFPNRLLYLQLLSVGLSQSNDINAPNFMDDEGASSPGGPDAADDFTEECVGDKRSASDDEGNDDDESMVLKFKRSRQNK